MTGRVRLRPFMPITRLALLAGPENVAAYSKVTVFKAPLPFDIAHLRPQSH
jgi:hypothetical protein